jgi:hypothetical protein
LGRNIDSGSVFPAKNKMGAGGYGWKPHRRR